MEIQNEVCFKTQIIRHTIRTELDGSVVKSGFFASIKIYSNSKHPWMK